ncbi:hypothetical protein, partial [Enterobacter hormaechei]
IQVIHYKHINTITDYHKMMYHLGLVPRSQVTPNEPIKNNRLNSTTLNLLFSSLIYTSDL